MWKLKSKLPSESLLEDPLRWFLERIVVAPKRSRGSRKHMGRRFVCASIALLQEVEINLLQSVTDRVSPIFPEAHPPPIAHARALLGARRVLDDRLPLITGPLQEAPIRSAAWRTSDRNLI